MMMRSLETQRGYGDWDGDAEFTLERLGGSISRWRLRKRTKTCCQCRTGTKRPRAARNRPVRIRARASRSMTVLCGCACFPALSVVRGWSRPNSFASFVWIARNSASVISTSCKIPRSFVQEAGPTDADSDHRQPASVEHTSVS